MSFFSRETSLFGGRPIRLYEFQRGVFRWRYTGADRDVQCQINTFTSIAISDDGLRQTGEVSADGIKVRVPWNNPVARLFRGVPPTDEIALIVRDLHLGESEFRVAWSGSIQGVRWPSPERAEILGQTFGASMQRMGLVLGWERNCPYAVYSPECGVNRDLFAVPATIQSLTGVAISSGTFDAQPDGYFAGGLIEWPIGSSQFDQRGIVSHVGSELVLLGGTDGLAVGQSVTAYPGCPGTIQVCNDRFNNKDNHGGIPHMPGKSPFDGDPIFW